MFFDKKIAFFHQEFDDDEETIIKIADYLEKKGFVKNGFAQAVVNREKQYPTGLPTEPIGVAIPHTDGDFVNTPQVAFASLKKPVKFKVMGGVEEEIPVSLVFMLALNKAEDQLDMLQKLVTVFQDAEIIKKLWACHTQEEYDEILKEMNLK